MQAFGQPETIAPDEQLNRVYVLVVAVRPLPTAPAPAYPTCVGDLVRVEFVPAHQECVNTFNR